MLKWPNLKMQVAGGMLRIIIKLITQISYKINIYFIMSRTYIRQYWNISTLLHCPYINKFTIVFILLKTYFKNRLNSQFLGIITSLFQLVSEWLKTTKKWNTPLFLIFQLTALCAQLSVNFRLSASWLNALLCFNFLTRL